MSGLVGPIPIILPMSISGHLRIHRFQIRHPPHWEATTLTTALLRLQISLPRTTSVKMAAPRSHNVKHHPGYIRICILSPKIMPNNNNQPSVPPHHLNNILHLQHLIIGDLAHPFPHHQLKIITHHHHHPPVRHASLVTRVRSTPILACVYHPLRIRVLQHMCPQRILHLNPQRF